jgi:hypothetical protein
MPDAPIVGCGYMLIPGRNEATKLIATDGMIFFMFHFSTHTAIRLQARWKILA